MMKYLAGPLIGAVIGYFTNYIAVRMLFRPRTEKRIFGHRVPLTPGAIPKGKTRLAHAAGEVVANHLVTEEDISSRFLSPEAEAAVTDRVMAALDREIGEDLLFAAGDEAAGEELRSRIDNKITEEIVSALLRMDMEDFLNGTVRGQVEERVSGTVLTFLVNGSTLDAMMGNLGNRIKDFIEEHGYDKIHPIVSEKTESLYEKTALGLFEESGMDAVRVRSFVSEVYRTAVRSGISAAVRQLDVAGMIEVKINGMSAEELERLVLSVMKKELDTIVRLGALIGALIGVLNIFI